MLKQLQALYAIFARLSQREKLILYVTVSIVSLMVLDRLIISPLFHRMRSSDEMLVHKIAEIKKNIHILSQKDRILKEGAKYYALMRSLESEQEQVTVILKEIEKIANNSSVYLVDMKPGDVKNLGTSKKYIINLSCEAQMEQLASFMYNIESSDKLLTIEKYQISPKAAESSVATCSMSITKMVIP
jgi:Pilus assembly protein, PilO.